jgi:hypothetical protein
MSTFYLHFFYYKIIIKHYLKDCLVKKKKKVDVIFVWFRFLFPSLDLPLPLSLLFFLFKPQNSTINEKVQNSNNIPVSFDGYS